MATHLVSISGSDLSGSNGGTNRTYTLSVSDFDSSSLQIFISGVYAYQGANEDYTVSGSVITFLNSVFDVQVIDIYYQDSSSAATNTSYGTTLQLARFMGIEGTIPDRNVTGSSRIKETVGTGDNSTLVFYLDYAFVLADSYILYYGSTEAGATALTETTHYTLDKDDGKVTLTTAGRTLVSTNNIYAEYSYCVAGLTDTQLSDALGRAEKQIDSWTNNHFVDGTGATPDWNQHLDEVQDGQGAFINNYFTLQNYPLPDVSTLVNGAITANDATITVDSTAGFPSSGYILIDSDKIAYTGKTTTTFTGCTSVEAHNDNSTIKPYVVEISTTEPGGTITWDVLGEGTEFELDKNTGRIHIYQSGLSYNGTYIDVEQYPLKGVASRLRASYISGFETIPTEIVKATLMLASKDLMSLAVRKSHVTGLNGFNPTLIDVDNEEILKTISAYRNEQYARV